jgi:hypothetical protein
MSAHDHRVRVAGCFRCELGADVLTGTVFAKDYADAKQQATSSARDYFGHDRFWITLKGTERYMELRDGSRERIMFVVDYIANGITDG